MSKSQKVYTIFKNIIDFIGSILGILVCFTLLWWWIFIINLFVTRGHPVFRQERLGKNKKIFKILKFRTMKKEANPYLPPSEISGEQYYKMETSFGRFLRKTSLDETLQLFNILFGQMSFIGPRPGAAINENNLILEREKFIPNAYMVKPGLSGLAQISLSDKHNASLKAEIDSKYVSNISFLLDAKLFFKTIFCFFNSFNGGVEKL